MAKHVAHSLHLTGVEMAKVDGCQLAAVPEHATHVCHFAGVEIFPTFNAFQIEHIIKPFIRSCRERISKRWVENGFCRSSSGIITLNPTRHLSTHIQTEYNTIFFIRQPVVVEGNSMSTIVKAYVSQRCKVTWVIGTTVDVGV